MIPAGIYPWARAFLFRLEPECAHDLCLKLLSGGNKLGLLRPSAPGLPGAPVRVMGLEFPNPVGMAAGFDKDGTCMEALSGLGFGFVEVGTVTPRPQPGNPGPRLFRLEAQQALINRMGFNNQGVEALASRLKKVDARVLVGVNIGKNKDTPLELAHEDYLVCLRKVYFRADYVTVNLSSPNTPGLRKLQFGSSLTRLLDLLKEEQGRLSREYGRYVPIAVKLAPDMDDDALCTLASQLVAADMDALVATNTTLTRPGVDSKEAGGLSGRPLGALSTSRIQVLAAALAGRLPIIGVGGIMTADDAVEKMRAGASLVQLYSGFVFQGPELVVQVARALAREGEAGVRQAGQEPVVPGAAGRPHSL
ncbi:MAG: quinone-dependent dihydroorotate dehydrogenase [Kistimonas sp.]|nr:quinone-dependent dihydroorotate dehydrogenase [Kistimonas sp.]